MTTLEVVHAPSARKEGEDTGQDETLGEVVAHYVRENTYEAVVRTRLTAPAVAGPRTLMWPFQHGAPPINSGEGRPQSSGQRPSSETKTVGVNEK